MADYRGQYLSTERGFCLSEANNRTKVKQRLWDVLINMGECACMFMHEYFSLILIWRDYQLKSECVCRLSCRGLLTGRKCAPCVVAGVSASERTRKKKKKKKKWDKGKERKKRRGRGGGRRLEVDEKERGNRSRKVLCLWKRGKHGDKGYGCRLRPWGRTEDLLPLAQEAIR